MNFLEPVDLAADPVAVAQFTQQPIQPHLMKQNDRVDNTLMGLFFILLFMSFMGGGLWYRKHRQQRTNARLQQVQTLERIWNVSSHR